MRERVSRVSTLYLEPTDSLDSMSESGEGRDDSVFVLAALQRTISLAVDRYIYIHIHEYIAVHSGAMHLCVSLSTGSYHSDRNELLERALLCTWSSCNVFVLLSFVCMLSIAN